MMAIPLAFTVECKKKRRWINEQHELLEWNVTCEFRKINSNRRCKMNSLKVIHSFKLKRKYTHEGVGLLFIFSKCAHSKHQFISGYKFLHVDPCIVATIDSRTGSHIVEQTIDTFLPLALYTRIHEIYRLVLLLPHLYEWISQWKWKWNIQCTTARNLRVGFLGYAIEIEYNLVFNSQASQLLYWQEWKIIQEFDGEKCGICSFHSSNELNGMKSAVTDQIRWTLFNRMLFPRKPLDYSCRQSIYGIPLLFRENMPKNLHFQKMDIRWKFTDSNESFEQIDFGIKYFVQ